MRREWIGGVAVLLAVGRLMAAVPLEPTVTAKEAALLTQAAAVAVTNALQAAALLVDNNREDASAALDFATGNFYFQMEAYEKALAAYQEAVRKLPSFRNARKNTGRIYLLLGQEDEAIRGYQELVADGHFDADIFLLLGHGLMMRHHAVPAESAYRQALMLDPEHRDAQRGLIQALLEQQRFAEVRSLLRTALDGAPEDASLWSLLVNVEVALDHAPEAIRAAETARRLDACPPALLMLLGDLYLDAGRAAEAVACYDEARAAGGIDMSRFLRAVEGLVMLGDATRAASLLEAVQASAGSNMDAAGRRSVIRLRAEIAALNGDLKASAVLYRDVTALDPLDSRALLRLGDLLRETGDAGEAELVYERAGRLPGAESDSFLRRARLAADDRRFPDAIELLEAAQQIDPQPQTIRYLEQLRRLAN